MLFRSCLNKAYIGRCGKLQCIPCAQVLPVLLSMASLKVTTPAHRMLCDGRLALGSPAASSTEREAGDQKGVKRALADSEGSGSADDSGQRPEDGKSVGSVVVGTPNKKPKDAGQQGKGDFETPLGKQAPAATQSPAALTPELEAALDLSF